MEAFKPHLQMTTVLLQSFAYVYSCTLDKLQVQVEFLVCTLCLFLSFCRPASMILSSYQLTQGLTETLVSDSLHREKGFSHNDRP